MKQVFLILASIVLTLAVSPLANAHPQVPGPPQKQAIALVNATIHPLSGPVIEKGTLVFDGGKIKALGGEVSVPAGTKKIDLEGKHVYPGLFEPFSDVGLVEINSVRATYDAQET